MMGGAPWMMGGGALHAAPPGMVAKGWGGPSGKWGGWDPYWTNAMMMGGVVPVMMKGGGVMGGPWGGPSPYAWGGEEDEPSLVDRSARSDRFGPPYGAELEKTPYAAFTAGPSGGPAAPKTKAERKQERRAAAAAAAKAAQQHTQNPNNIAIQPYVPIEEVVLARDQGVFSLA